MTMILLTSFYDAQNQQRNDELLTCWRKNEECKAFVQIIRFMELGERPVVYPVIGHKNTTLLWPHQRLTYRDYFEYANKHFTPGTMVCVSNSDIWFDDTLLNITDRQLDQRTFFACSRWGYMEDRGGWHWEEGFDRNGPVAQDAWIFRTPIQWGTADLNFTMGCMRCDNVLAAAMQRAGYRVLNPTAPGPKSLVLRHEHRSRSHNYGETVPGSMIFVHPIQLG